MTILLVGVCIDGKVRHNGVGRNAEGRLQGGITGLMTCEKCGGKGCPKVGRPPRPDSAAS